MPKRKRNVIPDLLFQKVLNNFHWMCKFCDGLGYAQQHSNHAKHASAMVKIMIMGITFLIIMYYISKPGRFLQIQGILWLLADNADELVD